MAFVPITEEEAQALNRHQLLQRVGETEKWLARRPYSAAKRAAGPECSRVLHAHLDLSRILGDALSAVRGERGVAYMDERIDGSPARPATRVQMSRRQRMPYGCKNVARPGPYGNPFTVAEHGDEAVPMFRDLLARPGRYPDIRYPSVQEIRENLAHWDLACWCPVPDGYISPAAAAARLHLLLTAVMRDQEETCHADVLLWVAAGGLP